MRRYVIFVVVCLALLLSSIGNSSASVAFPQMVTDFKTSVVVVGWVLTAYQLVTTVIMAVAGKISDTFGAKKAFVAFVALFCIGSALCAVAPNVYVLIGARVIQAIGGGSFMPCAAGVVSDQFPENRQRYIGLFSSVFPIGAIIGPNVGALLVHQFGWQSIFWLNIPLGIIILGLALWLLPSSTKKASIGSIDFKGAGLLCASFSSFIFAITQLEDNIFGTLWISIGVPLAASVVLFLLFWHRERHVKDPIVEMELLKRRPFMAANIYNFFYGVAALGIFSLLPLYAVSVYHMTTLQSGVLLTPRSIGMMAASTITSFFLTRWGYRLPMLIGSITVAVVCVLLALQPNGVSVFGMQVGATALLFVIVGLSGVGHGTATPASNNACIELMPDKVATITGLRGMFRVLGSSVGVAVSTLVISMVPDVHTAYFIVLIAPAVVMLVALPWIFMMPASPSVEKLVVKKQPA